MNINSCKKLGMHFFKNLSCSFLVLLLMTTFLLAQSNLEVLKLNEEDGLSNGFVTALLQDTKGFLWVGTAGGLNRFDGYSFKVFNYDYFDPQSLSHAVIWTICEDEEGYLWIGTDNGLNRFDPHKGTSIRFKHDASDSTSISFNAIESVSADQNGNIWVATANGLNRFSKMENRFYRYFFDPEKPRLFKATFFDSENTLWVGSLDTLYRYEEVNDSFVAFPLPDGSPEANEIRVISEDLQGELWIGTQQNGAFKYDKQKERITQAFYNDPAQINSLSHNKVASFLRDEKNQLWIGTYGGGLNIVDLKTNELSRIPNSATNPFRFNTNVVRSILQDGNQNIWMGSFYDGLYKVRSNFDRFKNFLAKDGWIGRNITSITQDQDENIWLASDGNGVFKLEPSTATISRILEKDALVSRNIKKVLVDQNGLIWMGTGDKGIDVYDVKAEDITRSLSILENENGVCLEWIQDLFLDSPGSLWIGTQNGLCKYDLNTKRFQSYSLEVPTKDGNNRSVLSINKDKSGNLWVCTFGGLNLFDVEQDTFSFFPFEHQVVELYEDSKGNIWISTFQGLGRWDQASQTLKLIQNEQLPRVPLHGILEDRQANIWFGSGKGIHRYNPLTGEVITFNKQDGLVGNHFLSGLKGADGQFYFGGMDGLVVFHPDSLFTESSASRHILTDFRLFNKDVPLQGTSGDTLDGKSPLHRFISYQDKVELAHWQNYFSIGFSSLDFTAPQNIRYQYKLENYDKEWVTTDAKRRWVTYTNIDPGKYTFRLRSADKTGTWGNDQKMLDLVILKPWWATWWAYLFYLASILGAIVFLYQSQLSKKLLKAETNRLQELDDFKSRLYTNVTHEFRTPLTIISSAAEKIRGQVNPALFGDVSIINKNVQRSLTLVQQLLDFTRLRSNATPINYVNGDLLEYLKYLLASFQVYAGSRGIKLHFRTAEKQLLMDFDEEKMLTIISNLLSNAIKFSRVGGEVKMEVEKVVKVEKEWVRIGVEDSGKGIAPELFEKVFDMFYQVNEQTGKGTGVGLALVKELVDLLKGDIRIESDEGKGAKFILTLPITRNAIITSSFEQKKVAQLTEGFIPPIPADIVGFASNGNGSLPTVLIAEDNYDLLGYLSFQLKEKYHIEFAQNGQEAIEKAVEIVPDIILSDVMMPKRDGFEVVQVLKNDERTSHIPIILLTAKADVSSRLTGLSRGADAYLVKPFNRNELLIRMKVLVQTRLKMQERYQKIGTILNDRNEDVPLEDAFMTRLNDVLEKNYSDPYFNARKLQVAMHLSRAQLYRKLDALTNTSVALHIRNYRLEKAYELIILKRGPVKMVAIESGFKDPDYFSRVYKGYFGFSPSKTPT